MLGLAGNVMDNGLALRLTDTERAIPFLPRKPVPVLVKPTRAAALDLLNNFGEWPHRGYCQQKVDVVRRAAHSEKCHLVVFGQDSNVAPHRVAIADQVGAIFCAEDAMNKDGGVGVGHPSHPGFYYGFVGVALAWQIAFLIIARDPVRYQPLMPALFLEKLLYPIAVFCLYMQGREAAQNLGTAMLDLVWFVLFVVVWRKLK
jgi:hypothetical protein